MNTTYFRHGALRSDVFFDDNTIVVPARQRRDAHLSTSPGLAHDSYNHFDKLREIVAAIDQRGSANLTRLTVLKKWFEASSRVSSFAIFIADQSSRPKTKTTKEAAELYREARTLLADVDVFSPKIPRSAATTLHARLRAFQNEHRNIPWGAVRLIHDNNLFLVECGLHIYLGHGDTPTEGYRLAASYCEHYDSRYGESLNGPSRRRIEEIIDFVQGIEAREKMSG